MTPVGRGPSPLAARATRLLVGGLVGGHGGLALSVVVSLIVAGAGAAVSAVLGAALVIAFFSIGQAVQIIVADRRPSQVLMAALASYAVRVAALGGLLLAYLNNTERFSTLVPGAFLAAVIVTVLGWLGGEIWTFTRLRIPVFDTEYVPDGSSSHNDGVQDC